MSQTCPSAGLYGNRTLIAYGNFVFRYRNKLFPLFLALLFVAFPTNWLLEGTQVEFFSDIAALMVGLAGEAIRVATVGLDYIKRGGLNKRVYADTLVETGIFAHCRNPLYVGNIVMAVALLMLFDNLWVLGFGLAFTLVTYISVVAAEEAYLRSKFGADYAEYCARVNRWLPGLSGLVATFRGATFNWRRVLSKELSSFFGWMVAAVAVEGLEVVVDGTEDLDDLVVFGAPFLAVTLLFIVGRIIRKGGPPALQS